MSAPQAAASAPAAPLGVRGVYGHDTSDSGYSLQASVGFNTFDANPDRATLDGLGAAGLKAFVWLGAWSNITCNWEHDDAWIQDRVEAVAASSGVLAYYLGDEPLASKCPRAPAMFRARTALVHQLAPGQPTLTVISAFDAGQAYPYAAWKGATDILGFDVYPCRQGVAQCSFDRIDGAIDAIRAAGITRYWAVIQAFSDAYYRMPTPGELHEEFQHWRRSDMSGYLVFSWSYLASNLESRPDEVDQLRTENAASLR